MTNQIKRLLIANRGEIACRIARTCKERGITPIAVFVDADKNALHRRICAESYSIPSDSYLDIDEIIALAVRRRADAVHPGYGFLSENHNFPRKLADFNIAFIGPTDKAMGLIGDKISARELANKNKIPIVPGITIEKRNSKAALKWAEDVGFPIVIKAAAGGGGRGIRIVNEAIDLDQQLVSASREAEKFFANGTVFLEKYIPTPRHIEVQVAADYHGNVLTFGDRDCSVQRNHQKVIEEAPAPNLSIKTRESLYDYAKTLFSAAEYHGVGTAEFLLDKQEKIYFLEVNCRLQVEHPVTEAVYGLDLVALQLEIAEEKNIKNYENLTPRGHALEARLCAEDPSRDFLPSTGILEEFACTTLPNNVRIDTGYEKGDSVSSFFDSMLAKVISHSETREGSIATLTEVLNELHVAGVATNEHFLRTILNDDRFRTAEHTTNLLASLSDKIKVSEKERAIAAVCYLVHSYLTPAEAPWHVRHGWRLFNLSRIFSALKIADKIFETTLHPTSGTEFSAAVNNSGKKFDFSLSVIDMGRGVLQLDFDHITVVSQKISHQWLKVGDITYNIVEAQVGEEQIFSGEESSLTIASPLPGRVVEIRVNKGDAVVPGQVVAVLESMKMEHPLAAKIAAKVASVHVKQKDTVSQNTKIMTLEI